MGERRRGAAESSSAWWYRRYRCRHHGFWNSRYQHYPRNGLFTNSHQTRCSNSSADHPERDSTRWHHPFGPVACIPRHPATVRSSTPYCKSLLKFVDPVTGVHTQHIESYWNKCKGRFKAMHRTTIGKLPSYLDEFMWRDRFDRTHQDCFDNIQRHNAKFYPV